MKNEKLVISLFNSFLFAIFIFEIICWDAVTAPSTPGSWISKDIETAKQLLFDRIDTLTFDQRIFNFHDDFIQEMYNDAEKMVQMKIQNYEDEH